MPSLRTLAIACLTASAALLLAALGIALYGHRHELEWGNVPTWFAGSFAVVASGISLRSYLVARASFAHTTAKHEDDLAAQARLVVVEYDDQGDTVELNIRNHSDSIIFDAELDLFHVDHDGTRVPIEMDEVNSYTPDTYQNQNLLPGKQSGPQVYFVRNPPFEYVATFTDARGVRWERANKAQPERVLLPPKTA